MSKMKSPFHISPDDPDAIIQLAFWVPNRVWATAAYLVPLRNAMAARREVEGTYPLNPAVQAMVDWLHTPDGALCRLLLDEMIVQSNLFVFTHQDDVQQIIDDGDFLEEEVKPGLDIWLSGPDELFEIMSYIIEHSPGFNNTEMVGTPLNGLLAVPMGTPAGFQLFSNDEFNVQMRNVLNAWNTFLKSPESLDKLDISDPEKPGSWISQQAYAAGVWQEMQYDPDKPGYGFASWNDFFIREFVLGARPFQGDPAKVVNIGCETTPWKYQDNVQFLDVFDIKDGKYSLIDIFDGDKRIAQHFVGGQVYQGFLSATHYHRWRAPLMGRIVYSRVIEGTYFAQNPSQGENQGTWAGTESQPYLPQVATRAIFVFEHDTFGYVAMICVGMVEVSTCVIYEQFLVPDGASPVAVEPGVEIGRFEFGGSTHLMVFQRGKANLVDWAKHASRFRNDATPQPMGSIIAMKPQAGRRG